MKSGISYRMDVLVNITTRISGRELVALSYIKHLVEFASFEVYSQSFQFRLLSFIWLDDSCSSSRLCESYRGEQVCTVCWVTDRDRMSVDRAER